MAEQGVVVEVELGVEHQQLALVGHDQGVDLDLRGVGVEERVEELRENLPRLLGEVARQAERGRDRAAVVRHQAGRRVDGQRWIFSGVSWATASMSMPPSVEATMAIRPLSRSTSRAR